MTQTGDLHKPKDLATNVESGFYKQDLPTRRRILQEFSGADLTAWQEPLPIELADQFIENVVGTYALPIGVAVGVVVDGTELAVPMVVEESSVVAAASHGAKLAAAGGGFTTKVDEQITIGQIEIREPKQGMQVLAAHRAEWISAANKRLTSMVARGGGVRDIIAREVPGRIVLHVLVNCQEAMGANVVNTVCEDLGAQAAAAFEGTLGLRILSNLATSRMATATARIPISVLGEELAKGMVAANDFALADPYRAATHNKGILNGIDPIAIATGNDWRAIEAGAHAYAALDGYKALTAYSLDQEFLHASLTMPMSVGTVGGITRLHPGAKASLRVLGSPTAKQLAGIMVSVGLAQNISALRALAGEGIQKGHMGLHARNIAMQAGVDSQHVDEVAKAMVANDDVHSRGAMRWLEALRKGRK